MTHKECRCQQPLASDWHGRRRHVAASMYVVCVCGWGRGGGKGGRGYKEGVLHAGGTRLSNAATTPALSHVWFFCCTAAAGGGVADDPGVPGGCRLSRLLLLLQHPNPCFCGYGRGRAVEVVCICGGQRQGVRLCSRLPPAFPCCCRGVCGTGSKVLQQLSAFPPQSPFPASKRC